MLLKLSNCEEYAILDEEDYERLVHWCWRKITKGYVTRTKYLGGGKNYELIYMHREVMGAEKGQMIDHKNKNKLDNRKENLRFATQSQNGMNRDTKKNKNGYRGVKKEAMTWSANITLNGKLYTKCGFKTVEEAARAYNEMAIHLHGEFAVLNDV